MPSSGRLRRRDFTVEFGDLPEDMNLLNPLEDIVPCVTVVASASREIV